MTTHGRLWHMDSGEGNGGIFKCPLCSEETECTNGIFAYHKIFAPPELVCKECAREKGLVNLDTGKTLAKEKGHSYGKRAKVHTINPELDDYLNNW